LSIGIMKPRLLVRGGCATSGLPTTRDLPPGRRPGLNVLPRPRGNGVTFAVHLDVFRNARENQRFPPPAFCVPIRPVGRGFRLALPLERASGGWVPCRQMLAYLRILSADFPVARTQKTTNSRNDVPQEKLHRQRVKTAAPQETCAHADASCPPYRRSPIKKMPPSIYRAYRFVIPGSFSAFAGALARRPGANACGR